MRRFAAALACLAVAVAAGVPAATPADAARKQLTLKQKKQRCLKKAAKRRTRKARRAAAKRCRKRYARRRPATRAPTGTPGAPAPTPAPGTTSPPPTEPLSRYVTVSAREFYFTLSRPVVAVGQVRVELRNQGEDPHDLVVERSGTEVGRWGDVGPGAVQVKTLTLSAGAYSLFCSIEGHKEIGMKATLRVGG